MTQEMDLRKRIRPVPRTAVFQEKGYYVWGASMVRTPDGVCHLFYSRWPEALRHHAWVTDSEIAHAVSEHPLGPYRFKNAALPARGASYWDGLCTHNPTVLAYEGRYYLYYMGTRSTGLADGASCADSDTTVAARGDKDIGKNGTASFRSSPPTDEEYWDHRNNQRIGVAVADHPDGPWERFDAPVIDVDPGQEAGDSLMVSNPSVTPCSSQTGENDSEKKSPGGKPSEEKRSGERLCERFLMVYKGCGRKAPLPLGGPVLHWTATAESPTGPFTKHPGPVFTKEGVNFAAEDPFIWYQEGKYRAIVKDMHGYFTDAGKSLTLWESIDGFDWRLSRHPLVTGTTVMWEDGTKQRLNSLERPQLWLEDGEPAVLFCAADEDEERSHSFNVHIPLKNLLE